MRLWSIRNTKISRDGEAIGISFGYGPLRDPRVYPVNTIDLIPTASAKVTASDEFYAKFHSIVTNDKITKSVFSSWLSIESTEFDTYKSINLKGVEYSRFSRAAMTGYLMAVCEKDVFKTFRQNEMATYIVGAMQIYINDIERETSRETQEILLTGLLSGYHKAHSLYKEVM